MCLLQSPTAPAGIPASSVCGSSMRTSSPRAELPMHLHSCTVRKLIVLLLALMFLSLARQASAELIFFSADRSMSVKGHRFDGDTIIVTLRGGGEMTFDKSLITS